LREAEHATQSRFLPEPSGPVPVGTMRAAWVAVQVVPADIAYVAAKLPVRSEAALEILDQDPATELFQFFAGMVPGTQLISSVLTGTAPLSVTSTTPVANLTVGKSPDEQVCGTISTC